jgi:hypothetical protein
MRVLLLLCVCGLIYAQGSAPSGSLSGHVRRGSGGPVADAIVHLQSKQTELSAKTDKSGDFRLDAIPAGSYALSIEWQPDGNARLSSPFTWPVQGGVVSLTVNTDNSISVLFGEEKVSTGGEDLQARAVAAIPLNKRDFSQLLLLAAGTMTDANGATNFTAQFAINGQRGVEAVFAMDGADTSDPEMGGATFSNFNVDAVSEIQSSSGWLPAEIGRGAAGFSNIITRSGTNAVHGSQLL